MRKIKKIEARQYVKVAHAGRWLDWITRRYETDVLTQETAEEIVEKVNTLIEHANRCKCE